MTAEVNRIDRLEALAETILLAIQAQQQQRNQDRQEFLDSTQDVIAMIGTMAEEVQLVSERVEAVLARVDQNSTEIRGLQTENRRILDFLLNQQDQ
jgi:hypothetical protein